MKLEPNLKSPESSELLVFLLFFILLGIFYVCFLLFSSSVEHFVSAVECSINDDDFIGTLTGSAFTCLPGTLPRPAVLSITCTILSGFGGVCENDRISCQSDAA